jgi:methionine sulfoxide reductase heme-binding subunit
MKWLKRNWLWAIINTIALALFGGLLGSAVAAGFAGHAMHELVGSSGSAAMIFLVLSLAMTPLQIVFGWKGASRLKKSTGLWAFGFTVLHLLAYEVGQFDLGARMGATAAALALWFGGASLLIMLALAITSTNGWMRRMGVWWKRLHRLVYAAGVLAVLHVALLSGGQGIVLGVVMAALLGVRIPPIKRAFVSWHQRRGARWLAAGTALPAAAKAR